MVESVNHFYRRIQERKRAIEAARVRQASAPPPPVKRHEQLVRWVLADHPLALRVGFRAAVRKLYKDFGNFDAEELALAGPYQTPDAYIIDREGRAVVSFEVEDKHPLSDRHLKLYMRLALSLHDIGFRLVLVPVSRWGATVEMDLTEKLYADRGWQVTAAMEASP